VLEIKDNSDTQFRDSQIVQHQSTLMISNSVDHLSIHDNSIKCDQIGNEEAHLVPLVEDIKERLLPKRNVSQPKFDGQRILVWLLKQAMTQRVKNLNSRADNFEKLLLWPTTSRYLCPLVLIRG